MLSLRTLLVSSALLCVTSAQGLELGKRTPIQAVGIEKNKEGFGSEALAKDEAQAALAPPSIEGKKNATIPLLKDRSMELVDRQSCDVGYWYCSGFGKCCPRSYNCCNYGYCIDPDSTCCPNGPCDPGFTCCSANSCAPKDGECCADGNYCENGNICVKLISSGRNVCCTDLSCTAAVISGTTSYMTTASQPAPSVTAPPPVTSAIASVGGVYETWYWTITWWYLSFYWTSFHAESTVTYITQYETTTYTTTATDEFEASSLFAALSESLTFTPPANAETSLASLLTVQPSETEAASFSFGGSFTTGGGNRPLSTSTSTTSRSSSSTSRVTLSPSNPNPSPGGASSGSGVFVQFGLVAMGALSGVLMVLL